MLWQIGVEEVKAVLKHEPDHPRAPEARRVPGPPLVGDEVGYARGAEARHPVCLVQAHLEQPGPERGPAVREPHRAAPCHWELVAVHRVLLGEDGPRCRPAEAEPRALANYGLLALQPKACEACVAAGRGVHGKVALGDAGHEIEPRRQHLGRVLDGDQDLARVLRRPGVDPLRQEAPGEGPVYHVMYHTRAHPEPLTQGVRLLPAPQPALVGINARVYHEEDQCHAVPLVASRAQGLEQPLELPRPGHGNNVNAVPRVASTVGPGYGNVRLVVGQRGNGVVGAQRVRRAIGRRAERRRRRVGPVVEAAAVGVDDKGQHPLPGRRELLKEGRGGREVLGREHVACEAVVALAVEEVQVVVEAGPQREPGRVGRRRLGRQGAEVALEARADLLPEELPRGAAADGEEAVGQAGRAGLLLALHRGEAVQGDEGVLHPQAVQVRHNDAEAHLHDPAHHQRPHRQHHLPPRPRRAGPACRSGGGGGHESEVVGHVEVRGGDHRLAGRRERGAGLVVQREKGVVADARSPRVAQPAARRSKKGGVDRHDGEPARGAHPSRERHTDALVAAGHDDAGRRTWAAEEVVSVEGRA